jgi:hypothetical protein
MDVAALTSLLLLICLDASAARLLGAASSPLCCCCCWLPLKDALRWYVAGLPAAAAVAAAAAALFSRRCLAASWPLMGAGQIGALLHEMHICRSSALCMLCTFVPLLDADTKQFMCAADVHMLLPSMYCTATAANPTQPDLPVQHAAVLTCWLLLFRHAVG